jgi:hypothetical protein
MREEIASGDAFLLLAALCLLAVVEMQRRVLHSVPMRDGSTEYATWLDQHARRRMANRCIRARWIGARAALRDRAGGGFGSIFPGRHTIFPTPSVLQDGILIENPPARTIELLT